MKKAVSLLIVLALLCTLSGGLSLSAHAADASGKVDNLSWRVENNVLTISGSGIMMTINSHEEWGAFYSSVTRIVIEPGVTSIAISAFRNFRELTEVSIPGTVTTIGNFAFENCPKLAKIEIPEGVVSLGGECFVTDTALTEISLPSTLESIGYKCFCYCTALTELELPASLTSLGANAFDNCTALRKVTFGSGLTKLPVSAFTGCKELKEVVLPDTLREIGGSAFFDCWELETVVFPEGLEVIGARAFGRTPCLYKVDLPASVREIGDNAFYEMGDRQITIRNPECVIAPGTYPDGQTLGISTVVVGYYGSTAYDYAMEKGFQFVALDGCAEGRHAFTQVEILTQPTCQSAGERKYTCEFCGETKTEPIPAVDHNDVLVQVLQAPTYFEDGRGLYGCTMCGRTYEDAIKKRNPGYLYQEVLYDRDDWSGAYLLGGYTFNYFHDGSYELAGIKLLSPRLTPSYQMTLTQRFNICGVQPNTAEYTFVFEKLNDGRTSGSYTIRSYWTGKYLAHSGKTLVMQDELNDAARWIVFVDSEGYFVIGSEAEPGIRLLYNEVDGCFQLLDTYTYQGTTYQASDLFGIWLYEPDPCANFLDVDPRAWYHEGIDFAVSNGLFNGVSSSRFGVDSTMTRAMFVTVLWRMQGSPEVEGGKTFTDVPAGTWYTDAVAWASSQGIVNGTSDTTFSPDAGITREQMAVLMYRYAQWLKLPTDASGSLASFPDAAKVSGYATEALAWATKLGIVTGTTAGNTIILKPQGSATRAQVATILMRFILAYL